MVHRLTVIVDVFILGCARARAYTHIHHARTPLTLTTTGTTTTTTATATKTTTTTTTSTLVMSRRSVPSVVLAAAILFLSVYVWCGGDGPFTLRRFYTRIAIWCTRWGEGWLWLWLAGECCCCTEFFSRLAVVCCRYVDWAHGVVQKVLVFYTAKVSFSISKVYYKNFTIFK